MKVKVAQLCPTLWDPWTGILQAPFPSPGDLLNPGIKPRSLALQEDSLPAEPQGKPMNTRVGSLSLHQQIFPTQGSHLYLLCLLHWRISGGFFTTVLPGKPKYALGLPISNTKGRKYLLVL